MTDTIVTQPIFKVPVWMYSFLPTFEKPARGIEEKSVLVEAENKTKARLSLTEEPSFWRNYNNLSPEERKKIKAPLFRLSREGKIEKILDCEKRHKNNEGDYTCGKPIHSLSRAERKFYSNKMDGEFGMCCIEGYDFGPNCPYDKK